MYIYHLYLYFYISYYPEQNCPTCACGLLEDTVSHCVSSYGRNRPSRFTQYVFIKSQANEHRTSQVAQSERNGKGQIGVLQEPKIGTPTIQHQYQASAINIKNTRNRQRNEVPRAYHAHKRQPTIISHHITLQTSILAKTPATNNPAEPMPARPRPAPLEVSLLVTADAL